MTTAEDYAWVEEEFADAVCVTVVTGRTQAEVLAAFGADPTVEVPFEDAYGGGDDGLGFVATYVTGDAVVAVEPNGWAGSRPELLAELSSGSGVAASVFWNVNDDNAFTCARDGEIEGTVDLYDAEDAAESGADDLDLPDRLVPLFLTAAPEDSHLHAVGLALVEAYVGVPVRHEDVTALRVAHPYPDRP